MFLRNQGAPSQGGTQHDEWRGDAFAEIRRQTTTHLVEELGLVNGPAQLHAVVALGKFAYWAVTTASGVTRSLIEDRLALIELWVEL